MFQLVQSQTLPLYQSIDRLLVAEAHGDGDVDIVAVGLDARGLLSYFLLLNDGTGSTAHGAAMVHFPGVVAAFTLAEGDFTGDGELDAVVGRAGSFQAATGGPGWSLANPLPETPIPGATGLIHVGLGDFTGDANLDLFVADEGTDIYAVLEGDGSGAFDPVALSWSPPHSVGQFVVLPSIDGDGRPDVAMLSDGGAVRLLLSSTGFGAGGTPPPAAPGDNTSILTADLNGDGRADLVIANASDESVHIHLATASGWSSSSVAVGADPQQVIAADFDGDGDLDLATVNAGGGGNISVAVNDGAGGFGAATGFGGFLDARSVVAADLNGDGRDDLVFSHGSANVSTLISTGFAIGASTASQAEGDSGATSYTFTVTRYGSMAGAVQVDWSVAGFGPNAADATDFAGPIAGTATFAAGVDTATVTVTVAGDTAVEADEGFQVTLSNASGGMFIAAATATAVIQNDDAPAPPAPPPAPRPIPTLGGAGNDLAILDRNATTYSAGDGDDLAMAEGGNDTVHGNLGADTMYGGPGDDVVHGGQGFDVLYGDDGEDLLFGDRADDFVHGGRGKDVLFGGEGSDALAGGQGDDVLRGGEGADVLTGDKGDDTLEGGAGADVFRFAAGGGADVVVDFSAGQGDRVQVIGAHTLRQEGADVIVELEDASLTLQQTQLSTLPSGWIF